MYLIVLCLSEEKRWDMVEKLGDIVETRGDIVYIRHSVCHHPSFRPSRSPSYKGCINQPFQHTNLHRYIVRVVRVGLILVTLTLFSRSHQYFEMSDFNQNRVSTHYLLNQTIDSGQSL